MRRISMENDREIRVPKFVSPLNMKNFSGSRRFSSKFDPYASSDSSDTPSPLMKYLLSADTAASPPAFSSTVNVEEDVIVMDGIPINSKFSKGVGEVRKRLPLVPFNSVAGSFGRSNSASSSSSGSGNRSGGSENSKVHKNRLCRFWEANGVLCQFGYECQFAHGKEELRPQSHRSSSKLKPEILELNNALEGSNSSYGSNSPPIRQVKATAREALSLPSTPTEMAFPKSPLKIKQPSESTIPSNTHPITTLLKSDWTPEDDRIKVKLPLGEENPPTEDADAYIEKVLYGTPARKRLPVFLEICPDH